MTAAFQPPANLNDFARGARPDALFAAWHKFVADSVADQAGHFPAFFNPLQPPSAEQPATAAPEWTGLPRTIKRLIPGSIANAAQAVENAIPMGGPDPMQGQFTPPFFDAATGSRFVGPAYRPQDEYLEWVTRRDPDGTISEILFTCEGPEYWEKGVALDQKLLVDLYRELSGDNEITIQDLVFPSRVTWNNPNDGPQTFEAGSYNPYDRWNIEAAIHLTQPANTLGAEIQLAKSATLLYGNPTPVTSDPDLICCAEYGGVNRASDPTIGSGVNTLVQLGMRVTLRDPIGLYMKAIRSEAFTLADDMPFPDAGQCFQGLRPAGGGSEMIVRARFRVPAGLTFKGRQLRVGDLKVNGEAIVAGGQVPEVITMRLFAIALPGAPPQNRVPCQGKPCPDRSHPEFIHIIPFGSQCPAEGIGMLDLRVEAARAAALHPHRAMDESSVQMRAAKR